jgi:two-component system, sensor histidine kinase
MDCEMPVMNGLTATQEIRKMEASGELSGPHRILALTGNARAGQVRAALDAGMDDVIVSTILSFLWRAVGR